MAAEIDRLEINISANSEDASGKVSALAASLEQLATASGKSEKNLYHDADGIAAIKDAAKNVDGTAATIERLSSSLSSISGIQPPQNLSQLAESFRPLADISQSISAFANTRNVDRAMENISSIAMGLTSLSQIDASGVERVRAFFAGFEDFGINVDAVRSMGQLTRSISNLSQIEFSETLSDNLRLFIDTVHAITEDDAQRIADIAESAQGLSNLGGEFDISREDVEEKNTEKTKHSFEGVTHAIEAATNAAKEFVNAIGKGGGAIAKGSIGWILSPLKKVGSGFANAAKKAGEFFSSIKRIAMYRAIRTAMKAISQGFQEGRENLYQYSLLINGEFAKSMDMAATSFLYLKNSIGAATAPLTNYFVPILDRMVDRIVEVINRFNELTAVLTGASTWTKAIKYPTQWQEAADDANAAAKKLKTTMLGFDELNVIEPNSSGSGGADDSGLDYSRMFTEVKVDMDLSEGMKSSMPAILEPIMSAWESTGAETLDKIANSWKNIKELVGGVRDTFLEIWENGTGQRSVELLLEITGNIARTFGNIASSIKIAWDNAGAGKRILQGVWNVANNIGTVFSRVWNDIANWAATLDFSPAMDALGGLFEAIQRLTDPDGSLSRAFVKVWNKIFLPLGSWVIEEGIPATIDLLTTAIEGIGFALEKYEPQINSFIDFLRELGSFTADNFIGAVTSLKVGIQMLMGEEVSDEDIEKLEKQRETQKNFLSRFEKIGYWLAGDETDVPDLVDYEAGQALHREEMQKNWNSPTEIVTAWDRFKMLFDAGYGNTDKYGNARYTGINNVDYAKWTDSEREDQAGRGLFSDFKSAWAMGFNGLFGTDIDPYETNREAIQNGKHPVISVLGDLLYPDKDSSGKSGASTTVASTAMIGGVNWDATLDPKEAQSTLQKIKGFFTDFKTNWNTGWDSIKQTASIKWENFKTDWSTGWDSIKKTAGDKWENLKTDWGNGVETIKQKWEGFKSNWGTGWESIKKSANEKWSYFQRDWGSGVETIKQKWEDFKKSWSDGWNQIYLYAQKMVGKVVSVALWIWQGSNGDGGIKKVINSMLSGIEGFFNFFVNGINFLINQLNSISINIPEKVRDIAGFAGIEIPANVSLNIPTISAFNLPRLATGGVVDTGQLFIARERGAELVGNYGNRTAVMNNDQIVDAVSAGVYRAVMDAMQNNSNNGNSEIKVYLDGRQIVTRTEEIKREKGASLIGGVVFA